ncbi:MAG: hypothetical protein JSR44_05025 [Spirochaetes bacterium]|nr:hypothetical protein [Spirochaetota bacterium]
MIKKIIIALVFALSLAAEACARTDAAASSYNFTCTKGNLDDDNSADTPVIAYSRCANSEVVCYILSNAVSCVRK